MADSDEQRPRVVILGGGFAGFASAKGLDHGRFDVLLVDRRPALEFLPNIHELLSGVKSPELLQLPLDHALTAMGHRFLHDAVTGVDPDERAVSVEGRPEPIGYDALVVALGGVDNTRGVDGVVEHAHSFKSVDDCARIGARLAEMEASGGRARIVIVGGGLEGVEALGEVLRRYRGNERFGVTLVEAAERLLPEAPATLDGEVRNLCRPYDVAFEMGAPVAGIKSDRVLLEDGRSLEADLVIWTGGPAPAPELASGGLAAAGAWVGVTDSLQSTEHEDVFVVGDAAQVHDGITKQAYHALDMGECAAENVSHLLHGREPVPFEPSTKPTLISFGDLSCFMVVGDRVVSGAALSAAKEGVFELTMAQLDPASLWQRIPDVTARVDRAAQALLWPVVTSPRALLRQAHLRVR